MLSIIFNLLKVLNSESDPSQISLAVCFSMVVGFTPFFSLHNIIIFLLVLLIRVNLSSFIIGTIIFSGVAYLLDSVFHKLGLLILTAVPLEDFWTILYNVSILRLENFNNSIVMGSLVFATVSSVPLFFILNVLITKYRKNVLAWIEKFKIMQILKASKLYSLYRALT